MRYITTYAIPVLCSAVLCGIMPFAASAQTYATASSSGTSTMSTSSSGSDLGNTANITASSSISQSISTSTTGVMNPAAMSSSSNNSGTVSAGTIAAAIAASHLYYYVNTRGLTATIIAPDATTALTMATDIDPHSGVALGEGALRPGMKIESVK